MAFTYNYGANPPIDYPRLLIADTVDQNHIFEDSEIEAMTTMQQLQFQSSMFWSGSAGRNLPATPVSYLRIAAMLLRCIAADKARLANALRLLDVQVNTQDAAQELRLQADNYDEVDDNAGAFAIIERCSDDFSFRDRFWYSWMRQSAN